MISIIGWIVIAWLVVSVIAFLGAWALCKAAARGDRMTEEIYEAELKRRKTTSDDKKESPDRLTDLEVYYLGLSPKVDASIRKVIEKLDGITYLNCTTCGEEVLKYDCRYYVQEGEVIVECGQCIQKEAAK